ncbi:hypothetical protein PV327_005892 [Microctonus hyperodae]|uniref:G-protein coupled receptors family 1 profile domain-containing protein n=1 Tax=Microctonus hyperodae TaxID=165561 RepID=A0AA39G2B0_MICHY|nr:hypothetical protein PV327_005892 [Microctonus hyperodae]
MTRHSGRITDSTTATTTTTTTTTATTISSFSTIANTFTTIDRGNVLLLLDDESSVNFTSDKVRETVTRIFNDSDYNTTSTNIIQDLTSYNNEDEGLNNWWAMLTVVLVVGTAAGNILVCLAITWERRLQNVTNYFLMSLAITDLMVAILVMPLGILTLVRVFKISKIH